MIYPLSSLARYYIWRWAPADEDHLPNRDILLPLELDPPARCFLHHAHVTGTLFPRKNVCSFLHNNYINIALWNTTAEQLEFGWSGSLDFDPYWSFENIPQCGFCDTVLWDTKWCESANNTDFSKRIIHNLEQGRYIEFNINEFFLLGCTNALKRDVRHHTMIYGFAETTQSFLCASYNSDGSYGTTRIPSGLVDAACRSQAFTTTPNDLSYSSPIKVREVGINKDASLTVDLKTIIVQLTQFANSTTSTAMALNSASNCGNATFGRSVYGLVGVYLKSCLKRGCWVNLNVSRFMWERQKLMCLRLKKLEISHAFIKAAGLSEQWASSERAFRAVHLKCYTHNMNLGKGAIRGLDEELYKASEIEAKLEVRALAVCTQA